jgi:hypothetical protein
MNFLETRGRFWCEKIGLKFFQATDDSEIQFLNKYIELFNIFESVQEKVTWVLSPRVFM